MVEFNITNKVMSWGRVVTSQHFVARPQFKDEISKLASDFSKDKPGLAIGMKRSYGDSCLNSSASVLDMTGLNRFISFCKVSGKVKAEAGITLKDLTSFLIPNGWFLPTTPGTCFVTLAGAVANDVHGKNHGWAGSFGCHVLSIGLRRTDGCFYELKPEDDLFKATIGGLGLTGIIEWVEFQATKISSSYLLVEDIAFESLDEYFRLSEESKDDFEHTVSWIDCVTKGKGSGRGIFSRANWADDEKLDTREILTKKRIPFDFPSVFLNNFTIGCFNKLFFNFKKFKAGKITQHYSPMFYPLDSISNWNRLYGKRGMYQYQCVIPKNEARATIPELLKEITLSGEASFLAVLKELGAKQSTGLLSFPLEGTTLALDFPNKGDKTIQLMERLDSIVRSSNGRLYSAKDGRISEEMFRHGYENYKHFTKFMDPGCQSNFARRVFKSMLYDQVLNKELGKV